MTRTALVASLFVTGLVRVAHAEEIKLGYADLQRALAETEDGRKVRATLKKEFDTRQKELDERQDDLRKQIEDLEKKRTLLTPDKVREKETEIQKKMQEAQQILLRSQQDLQQKEQAALQPILDRMQRIIAKMASTENFTMVLDKNQAGIVFAKPHLDLTNELIRRFNSGEGAGEKGPAKPAPAPAGGAKKK